MSHLHHLEEYPSAAEQNGSPQVSRRRRRHSHHSHVHLKPAAVLDHIKIKVKQKRSSNHLPGEIPAFAGPEQKREQYRHRRFHRHGTEPETKKTLASTRSEPNNHSEQGSDESSEELTRSIEKSSTTANTKYKGDDTDESMLGRADRIEGQDERSPSKDQALELKNKKQELATLRMRDDDLHQIFRDLPPNEKLMAAYPCAWRKDTFLDGRMFLTMNYLCFSTGFFRWEENLSIPYKDIVQLTKEQTSRALPNAIQLRTASGGEYFFTSYVPQEEIFAAVHRLWQNALLEKPLGSLQMQEIILANGVSIDESNGGSEAPAAKKNLDESLAEMRPHSRSLSTMPPRAVEVLVSQVTSTTTNVRAVSPPADKEQLNYAVTCPCESHLARTYVDRLFAFKLEALYELSFGDNAFTRSYHELQNLTDYTISEWHVNSETGKRERSVSYKALTQSILGSNTLTCSEKQTIEAEQPGSFCIVSTEVRNEGMKYTDAFYVATRFCMVQRDAEHTSLRISAEIKYVKNVNGIARAFIDKNANGSMESGINILAQRLEGLQQSYANGKSHHKHASTVAKQHTRKSTKHKTLRETKSHEPVEISSSLHSSPVSPAKEPLAGRGVLLDAALVIGAILVILHLYLCYKLYSLDRTLHQPPPSCLEHCQQSCSINGAVGK